MHQKKARFPYSNHRENSDVNLNFCPLQSLSVSFQNALSEDTVPLNLGKITDDMMILPLSDDQFPTLAHVIIIA